MATQQEEFSANARDVFSIPEIVDLLVQQAVDEKITGILYNCLTLNRLWFDKVARVFWEAESLAEEESPFFKIESQDRRQVYANFLQSTSPHPDFFDKIEGLQFPKLASAAIKDAEANRVESLLHTLPSSLSALSVENSTLTDNFFSELAEKFTSLEFMQMSEVKGASNAAFHGFLENSSSKILYFMDLHDLFVDPQAHVALSRNKTVEGLYIPAISDEALALIASLGKPSFVNVKNYVGSGRYTGELQTFLQVFPKLEGINTTVGNIDEAVQALAKYPHKVKSVTATAPVGNPTPQSFINFAKQQPDITRLRLGRMTNLVVEDNWFIEFVSHLPELTALSFYHTTANLTSKGLKAVGKSCSKLSSLVLAPGDLEDIVLSEEDFKADEDTVFPKLKVLRPTVSLKFNNEVLLKHFPILPAVNPSAAETD